MSDREGMAPRAHFIGVPAAFALEQQCRVLGDAYGFGTIFLVGSALEKRDYRDVDVRCMLDDDTFDRMFPGAHPSPERNALWSVTCAAISEWLATHTRLPIDFQIQRRTQANAMYDGRRHALGVFFDAPSSLTHPRQAEP